MIVNHVRNNIGYQTRTRGIDIDQIPDYKAFNPMAVDYNPGYETKMEIQIMADDGVIRGGALEPEPEPIPVSGTQPKPKPKIDKKEIQRIVPKPKATDPAKKLRQKVKRMSDKDKLKQLMEKI